ncbi:MAG: OmpH family outer membrane protein [Bacteroidota bacterium]|nr:OmpH family outer membrane protein [Bacteroidota bacterium]
MKHFSKLLILVLILGTSATVFGQKSYKFGHINSQELMAVMPERDSAQAVLEGFAKKLEDQLDIMQVEYNNKLQTYLADRDNLTELIKQAKEQELNDMQTRIQGFEQSAQQEMQRKQGELMQPIVDKAQKAIQTVAVEQGFLYIFDIAAGSLIYFSDDSVDILPMVKESLGIQ